MSEEKGSKLRDIKETASDAVEIMRELGTPGVQETFDKIREIAVIAKEIMETMKTPEWQQNIENIRLITDNMNTASARMDNAVKELKQTGVVDDAKELIKSARSKIDSFGGGTDGGGITSQDLHEVSSSFKEMLVSIRGLIDELKMTVAESKRSGTFHNIEEAVKETSNTYKVVKSDIER